MIRTTLHIVTLIFMACILFDTSGANIEPVVFTLCEIQPTDSSTFYIVSVLVLGHLHRKYLESFGSLNLSNLCLVTKVFVLYFLLNKRKQFEFAGHVPNLFSKLS